MDKDIYWEYKFEVRPNRATFEDPGYHFIK